MTYDYKEWVNSHAQPYTPPPVPKRYFDDSSEPSAASYILIISLAAIVLWTTQKPNAGGERALTIVRYLAPLILATGEIVPLAWMLYAGWTGRGGWQIAGAASYATLAQIVRLAPTHGIRAVSRGWDAVNLSTFAALIAFIWTAAFVIMAVVHMAAGYAHRFPS